LNAWILLGINVLLYGCEKVGPMPRLASWGYLTADMNGRDWSKTYENAYQVVQGLNNDSYNPQEQYMGIKSVLYTSSGYDRQSLTFQRIPFPPKKCRYKVAWCDPAGCQFHSDVYVSLYSLLSDGDVVGDSYRTVESEDNYIQIDEYDAQTRQVKGRFQITFAIIEPRQSDALPDTLRFVNGRFHTRIIEYKR
jgi:hypothetical protein